MAYWEIVTRSFRIAWRHKYLWLIALFAGESSGGFGGNGGSSIPTNRNSTSQSFNSAAQSAGTWVGDHAGLLVSLAIAALVLWIALFILGAICEGATVRASAEHDAERPFGLGMAWRCGVATMGPVLRLRLIVIGLLLPVGLVIIGEVIGLVAAIATSHTGAAVGVGLLLALTVLAAIPYSIYIGFLDRLGTRALVLEQVGARAGLSRGIQLVRKRLGRVLLVWLLSIAVGIVVGIVTGIAVAVVAVPFFVIGIASAAGGGGATALIPIVVIGLLVLLVIVLTVGGFLSAQSSTYWTLAFRRLELEPVPAPAGAPYSPASQPGPAAPPVS